MARRVTVAVFRLLGEQHPLTQAYRRKFSMALT
ncbi:MAG: tetratricopeptide repeat protein [Saprospiraceae bacterium]